MTANQISVDEIKRDLPKFLERIESGEKLVIIKEGRPLAEIEPINQSDSKFRPYGLCDGDFTVPDDFDSPLPEEITKEFEGK